MTPRDCICYCAILMLGIFVMTGCLAGGGGAQHVPPSFLEKKGDGYRLDIEFSVWGSEPKNLERRFTSLTLHYAKNGSAAESHISGIFDGMVNNHAQFHAIIPASDDIHPNDIITYHWTFLFDGHANSHPGGSVPVK